MSQPLRIPIDVTIPRDPRDPSDAVPAPEGVVIHRVPYLHPDDVTTLHGIRITTPSRTLVDLAEVLTREELRDAFQQARDLGLLDAHAVAECAGRVEWRPSLELLHEVLAEYAN